MKKFINRAHPISEKSPLTTLGSFMLVMGALGTLIWLFIEPAPFYMYMGASLVGLGFPAILAGLVCDHMSRIFNAHAQYLNDQE